MKLRPAALAALALALSLALSSCAQSTDATDNEADVMFAGMMIDHHAQAIEMSDLVLEKDGVDARVAQLAEQIKTAQKPEIELMEGWLDEWGAQEDGMAGMAHGDGMMTDDDMDALGAATGPDADRLFLEQMIEHHKGAIGMARDEIDNGQAREAVELAEAIIDAQSAEIEAMQAMLDEG